LALLVLALPLLMEAVMETPHPVDASLNER
jgi:hypothetical protein